VRVLHIYSGNLYGGVESMLTTIARHRGLEHEFALCFDGRLASEIGAAGATVHMLGAVSARRPHTAAHARRRLRTLLTAETFDGVICHAPWSQALLGGVVRRAGQPLTFWAHDVATGRHWTERLARRVVPDLAICNSVFTKRRLAALYPTVETEVVYPPVEPPAPVSVSHRDRIRASLDTAVDHVVVIGACRSEAWKGHELLLDSLTKLRSVPNWTWWQVGGAQRRAESAFLARLRRRAESNGVADRIRFVGERSDVRDLLAAADIYCQPNLAPEPFGIAFVEALFAALPVVTTSLGAADEIVDDSCGVLARPGDSEHLAALLHRLIENRSLRASLSAAGPARARGLCDPGVQLERLSRALAAVSASAVSP
jgi:glycosyltransferase involved in cell wall biosynthesis